MDSVDSSHPKCWLCGRNGMQDHLDLHHIFGGSFREKSERYGLTVLLCHSRCHLYGVSAAHQSRDTMNRIKEYGQRKIMSEQGWSIDRFRREFGKNYLMEG